MWSGASRPAGASRTLVPRTSTVAPNAARMRSVWSRDRAGSCTVTATPEAAPASRMALFTCALAVSERHSMLRRWPPRTVMGSPSAGATSTVAPISRKGWAMRRIGRRLRLASPTKRLANGSAAATPATSRVVVPLFPQSRSTTGAVSPRAPRPTIVTSADSGGIGTPSAPNTLAVLCTSADGRISRILDAPSASAAKINARCDSDLSPGTRITPPTFMRGALPRRLRRPRAASSSRAPTSRPAPCRHRRRASV